MNNYLEYVTRVALTSGHLYFYDGIEEEGFKNWLSDNGMENLRAEFYKNA